MAFYIAKLVKNGETLLHLFIFCPFPGAFWKDVLSAFNWSTALPGDPITLLELVFIDHPFLKQREVIWLNFIRPFYAFLRETEKKFISLSMVIW